MKHDGFLDVFDDESFHGSPFQDSASIMDASIMSQHNGIAIDLTIDASTRAFACSYTTSTGICELPLIDSLLWWQETLSDPSKTSKSLIVKQDGFLDVFDEESLHGFSSQDSTSIMDASIMSQHNGIAIDLTFDASPTAFACSYTSSTGVSKSFSEFFPPDLWCTEQIQLEIESVMRSCVYIIEKLVSLLMASNQSSKFMLLKTDCPALLPLIND